MNKPKRFAFVGVGAVLMGILALALPLEPAQAANGDLVYQVAFTTPCGLGFGVGLAFDGANLWYSCAGSPNLLRADPLTGVVSASYTIPVPGNLGALSYDATRNAIWAGAGFGEVWRIDLDASKNVTGSTLVFNTGDICSLDDGLAFDARNVANPNDDVLYYSDDCYTTVIDVYSILGGSPVESFTWAGPLPGPPWHNSGLAVGGHLLYQMSVFENKAYVVDKTTKALQYTFTVSTGHPEDMECDTNTFAAQGKHVMWTKDANGSVATAFEIEFGSCGVGGVPPVVKGRMTGGGSVPTASGVRVTHGFELHCDTSLPNNLEVNWSGNKFHLTQLNSATCTDDQNISEGQPVAGFDTFAGSGVGRLNGVDGATIDFKLIDAGEPGEAVDVAEFSINGGADLAVAGKLAKGNHQAHPE